MQNIWGEKKILSKLYYWPGAMLENEGDKEFDVK